VAHSPESRARKRSSAPFVFCRIRNNEVPIEQVFAEDSLEPLDGHPPDAHIHQRAPKLGDASLVMGEAALKDLAPSLLQKAAALCWR
jgi:hypothetical protein